MSTERYQYDLQGRLISTLDGNQNAELGLGATQAQINTKAVQEGMRNEYDILGNIRQTTDREGAQTLYYYDAEGNVRYEIDAEGQVTQYWYTSFNQRSQIIRYHTQLTAADISSNGLIGGLVTNTVAGGSQSIDAYLQSKVGGGEKFKESFSYTARGLLASKVDAEGYLTTFEYNAFAQLIKQTQRTHQTMLAKQLGRRDMLTYTEFDYDNRGLLTTTTLSGGNESQTSSKTYDAFGRVLSTTDGNNNTTNISYTVNGGDDKVGRVVTSTQVVDGTSREIITQYDMLGRVLSVKNASGHITQYSYDDNSNTTTVTQANGTQVKTTRNARGQIESVTQLDAQSNVLSTSAFEFDANGNVIKTLLNGAVQKHTSYDKNNRIHVVTDPNGNQVETQYDNVGRVIASIVDPKGLKLTTTFEHNKHGSEVIKSERINTVVSGGNQSVGTINSTTTTFDSQGRVLSLEVHQGGTRQSLTQYQYGGTDNQLQVTQGSGSHAVTTHYEYDALGRLVKSGKGAQITTYQYDNNNNVVKKVSNIDQRSKIELFTYNEANQLTATLLSAKHPSEGSTAYEVTRFEYDVNGQRIAEHRYASFMVNPNEATLNQLVTDFAKTNSSSAVSSYTSYDENGRKSLHINADGGVTQWHYDLQGRVFEVTRWGQRASVNATAQAQLKQGKMVASLLSKYGAATADSRIRTLYNDRGQARYTITLVEGTQASVKESRYDAAGQLIGTIAYSQLIAFDASADIATLQQHITSEEHARQSALFYDPAGRLRFSIDTLGYVTEQRYNEVNDVISEVAYGTSLADNSVLRNKLEAGTLHYEDLHTHFSAGLVSDARVNHSEYNAQGQLQWRGHADGTSETYRYNDNGLKASYTNQKGATWRYEYDDAGRLAFERGPEVKTYFWQSGVLKVAEGVSLTKAFSYDGLGNVTKITEGGQRNKQWVSSLPRSEVNFGYDNAGRQVRIEQAAAKQGQALKTLMEYDALGRMISSTKGEVTLNPYDASKWTTTLKVYDHAGNVRFEVDGEGNVIERQYNALGQEVKQIHYADSTTRVHSQGVALSDVVDSSGKLKQGNSLNLSASASLDREIVSHYDAAGHKVAVIAEEQHSRFSYNAFGEQIKQEQLLTGAFDKTYTALTNWYYFNEKGQKIAQVDADGYLTQFEYNGFGELSTQTEYAKAVTSALNTSTAPVGSEGNDEQGHNRVTQYHYDDMGRLHYEVKRDSKVAVQNTGMTYTTKPHVVTRHRYDELGNVVERQSLATEQLDVENIAFESSNSQVWEYDAIGRQVQSASAVMKHTRVNTDKSLSGGAVVSVNGRQVDTLGYDVFGNVVWRAEHYNTGNYDANTQKISEPSSSVNDRVTRHEYNVNGQLIKEVNAEGGVTTHEYNNVGLIERTRQQFTQWGSDNEHYRIIYQTYRSRDGYPATKSSVNYGLPPGFTFNPATGKLSGHVYGEPEEFGEKYWIDVTIEANYLSNIASREQSISFSAADGNKTVTLNHWRAPNNTGDVVQERLTTYRYNRNGQVKHKSLGVGAVGHISSQHGWSTAYNAFGEVSKDEKGSYEYNQQGQLYRTNKDDGVLKTYLYDKAGRMKSVQHALDGLTEYSRNGQGQVTEIKLPGFTQGGNYTRPTIKQVFDRWGNVIELTDAQGHITQAQYNYQNKVIKEILPIVSVVDEQGTTQFITPENVFSYDLSGNLISKTDANGHRNTFAYDENGNQLTHQDGEGKQTHMRYDIFGRKVSVKDAEGKVSISQYDKLDRVVETGQYGVINNTSGQYRLTNAYQYDELGNRTHEKDAMGGESAFKFDAQGHIIHSLDEMGRAKSYLYDSDGNQRLERYDGLYSSGNTDQNTRVFDDYGNLQSQNDLGGKGYSYEYGRNWDNTRADNQQQRSDKWVETLVLAGTTREQLDIGRLIRKTNEHGQDIRYSYYENGWLKSITDKATDAYSYFEYDSSGRRVLEVKQAWDDLKRVIRHETQTQYDSHGRIALVETTEFTNKAAAGQGEDWQADRILSRVQYAYDAVGNRRKMLVENGLVTQLEARENKLTTEQQFEFIRGAKSGGIGSITLKNEYGLKVDSLKVTYVQSGKERALPAWLEATIHQVDERTVIIKFVQTAEIPPEHGEFIVRFSAIGADKKVHNKDVLFKLTNLSLIHI
ncbi:hypothetical protein BB427_19110 [Pseudoalteromonas sp. BMB]|nr:RHS repeat protein [Pseudoalteromonas sp. BMB]ODB34621.1 hypothetical protein BB427_19110 [Pseudoalteromonas sp. BMB]